MIGLFAAIIYTAACNPTKVIQKHDVDSIIQHQFNGDSTISEFNSDRRFLLVREAETAIKAGMPIRFIVIRTNDGAILMNDRYQRGYIRWINSDSLEKLSMPGKQQADTNKDRYKTILRITK
jgi:hypothetical protein